MPEPPEADAVNVITAPCICGEFMSFVSVTSVAGGGGGKVTVCLTPLDTSYATFDPTLLAHTRIE